MYPSGAAQDRRVWIEVIVYNAANAILFSSGVVGDNQDPEDINDPVVNCESSNTPANKLCSGLWDRMTKTDGTRADFFWEVANETSYLLKPATTTVSSDPAFDHSTTATWDVSGIYVDIDHITARVRTRPFPYRTLDALVASGDLDASYAQSLTSLTGDGAMKTWDKATANTGASANTGCNFNGN